MTRSYRHHSRHIVLDMYPAPSHGRGHSSPPFIIFGADFACVHIIRGPCLLWPNSWMDQDAIWYGGRPRPRRHCVRWGPSSPKKGAQPQFLANFHCGQTAGWIQMSLGMLLGLGPGHIMLDGIQFHSPEGAQPLNFRPMSVVAKRLDGLRCNLVWR